MPNHTLHADKKYKKLKWHKKINIQQTTICTKHTPKRRSIFKRHGICLIVWSTLTDNISHCSYKLFKKIFTEILILQASKIVIIYDI